MNIQSACFIASINGKLCSRDYRLFAEWLGGYEYVLPEQRKLNPLLVNLLEPIVTTNKPTSHNYFLLWEVACRIEVSLNSFNQSEVAQYYLSWERYYVDGKISS